MPQLPSIELTRDDVHLWLAPYGELTDEALHEQYRALLTSEEREKEPRFHFERDRRRYLVSRVLVRTTLSRYVGVAPEAWRFSANQYGRPAAVNGEASDFGLNFNLSHTHSLIVLAVSRQRSIGVDVENIVERDAPIEIAGRFFAPAEVGALNALRPEQQQFRFFEYWTFKESYIKARGMGLSLPLDKFSFHFPDAASVTIEIDPALSDSSARWEFKQFQPSNEYLIALCAERAQETSVIARETVPLRSERELVMPHLRRSN